MFLHLSAESRYPNRGRRHRGKGCLRARPQDGFRKIAEDLRRGKIGLNLYRMSMARRPQAAIKQGLSRARP